MLKLTNVQLSSNGRVISDSSAYNESTNRGIRTHNRFGKFFADCFGSGTYKVYINDQKYYLNRNSCDNLIASEMACKSKALVIGQIQSIFDEMHGGKPLSQGRAVGFINYQVQMNQITDWVRDNQHALGSMAYREAMATIKFFQFINTEAGVIDIVNSHAGLYYFCPPNFELNEGIPFHFHDHKTEKEVKSALSALFSQFIFSLSQLKTDKQKTQFFKELGGLCIEAKTSNAFVYASSLASNTVAELEPFYVIAEKYRQEAHDALEGQNKTIDLLAQYINDNHGGERCLTDANLCPDGVISLESAKAFLGFTDFDLI